MHFGATLRLLRLESGLSLRDLARRLEVSGTYLSRVENGLDPIPTQGRLEAIARELDIPVPLIMSLSQRVSPFVAEYISQVPKAGGLFLDIAHRRLNERQLAEVQAFVNERFPSVLRTVATSPGILDLLTPDRIILGLSCTKIGDLLDVAAGRIAHATGRPISAISKSLMAREKEVPSSIGGGVAVPCVVVENAEPAGVLVTLDPPLKYNTPDKLPLRVAVVLAGPLNSADRRLRLAYIARLTAQGAFDQLTPLLSHKEVFRCLERLEAVR